MRNRHSLSRNRRARFEPLEQRQLLAADAFGTNPLQPLDVSRDGEVSALDALRVLNALRRSTESGIADPESSPGSFIDVSGDGQGTALDALRVLNAINRAQPVLAATLTNDTSSPNDLEQRFDLITSDYGFKLHVAIGQLGGSSVALSIGEFGDPIDVTNHISQGVAEFTGNEIDDLLRLPLRDGTHLVRAYLDGAESLAFPLTVDRSAPVVELTSLPESATVNTAIRLVGRSVDAHPTSGGSITIGSAANPVAVAEDGSFDLSLENLVDLGDNRLIVEFVDAAGNIAEIERNFEVLDTFVDGADQATGWIAQTDDEVILSGRDSFVLQVDRIVNRTIGESERLEFTVDVAEDPSSQATLLAYLLDPNDPSRSILADGPGKPFFRLRSDGTADHPAGRVRFDGSKVSLDMSDIDLPQVLLRFQRIAHNPSDVGVIRMSDFQNVLVDTRSIDSEFFRPSIDASIGPALELADFSASDSLNARFNARRLDDSNGNYAVDVSLHADADTPRRPVLVRFSNLPANVTLSNASGTDNEGRPYVNLSEAMPSAGLMAGQATTELQIQFDNPELIQFALTAEVFVGPENRAPTLPSLPNLTLVPGDVVELDLTGNDPDGDELIYQLVPVEPVTLPAGQFDANGTYRLNPLPGDEGTYEIDVIVSDGQYKAVDRLSLEVITDTQSTTRVSGRILDVDGSAISELQIDLGQVSVLTDATGRFTLDMGEGPLLSDTLKVRGELYGGPHTYPFIAEKLPLVLERDAFEGINNVIARPIFLPKIDVANGQTIDPLSDTTVSTPAVPGASVQIAAGTLVNQQGTAFDGILSITEVPVDLTPAALPSNLLPDLVLTIQPGEMVFTTPAPMTFPNRSGFEPGEVMDLWSINPVTGEFDNVGDMRVSGDGQTITTVEGGVRNSSWHFVAPQPAPEARDPGGEPQNQDDQCEECEATRAANSRVELHSGALQETHRLATYSSLGISRGLSLHYNSQHADPRPIVHFGIDNVPGDPSQRLMAQLEVFPWGDMRSGWQAAGDENGSHYFAIPSGGGNLSAALQLNLQDMPTGSYDYRVAQGLVRVNDGAVTGTLTPHVSELIHINERGNPLGAGWSFAKIPRIVENAGRLLLIEGDGSALRFLEQTPGLGSYQSPPGDYSNVQRTTNSSGFFNGYSRKMPDQSEYLFNERGNLIQHFDRVGNETRYSYDLDRQDQLTSIVDPSGLETNLAYGGDGRLESIIDPAGRVTAFEHDEVGNLTRITDPDSSSRQFRYDTEHRLIGETDQRGNTEQTFYGFHGRVERSHRKDGTEMFFDPLQTRVLLPPGSTVDPINPGTASLLGSTVARIIDPNGNLTETTLDQAGQAVRSVDDRGISAEINRNANNQVTERTSSRGYKTWLGYDQFGNVTSITDEVSLGQNPETWFFDPQSLSGDTGARSIRSADFNDDGILDIVALTSTGGGTAFHVATYEGVGNGNFVERFSDQITGPRSVTVGDVNLDGAIDFIVNASNTQVYHNLGDGNFEKGQTIAVAQPRSAIALSDITGDGIADLISANLTFYPGSEDGVFGPEETIAELPSGQFFFSASDDHVHVVDLNGDEHKDIVTRGFEQAGSFSRRPYAFATLGREDGGFSDVIPISLRDPQLGRTADVFDLKIADLNGDDVLDLVAALKSGDSARVVLRTGVGDGTFNPVNSLGGFQSTEDWIDLIIGEFSGDSLSDVASGAVLLTQQLDGTFSESPLLSFDEHRANYGRTLFEDFDGDGTHDLLVASQFGQGDRGSRLLRGTGVGEFVDYPVRDGFPSVSSNTPVVDFNGDGLPDAAYWRFGQLRLSLSDADGSYQESTLAETSSNVFPQLVVGNFSGDESLDIYDPWLNEVHVGDGNGSFTRVPSTELLLTNSQPDLTVADFNGDGTDDLIGTQNAGLNQVRLQVYLSTGDGTFVPGGESTIPSFDTRFGSHFRTADVNGDGAFDVIHGHEGSGTISIYLSDGQGRLVESDTLQAFTLSESLGGMLVIDIDADSNLEVVAFGARSSANGFLRVWDVDASGNFDASPSYEFSVSQALGQSFGRSLVAEDFNQDGLPDLAWFTAIDSFLFPGSGTESLFLTPSPYSAIVGAGRIDAWDIDFDGDQDLLVFGQGLEIVENLTDGDSAVSQRFIYDPNFSQLSESIDGVGRRTLYEIDPNNGNTLSETRVVGNLDSAANGETDDVVTRYTYTSYGLVDTITDPLGRVTDYDYDRSGRVLAITYAVGTSDEATERFEYDASTTAGLAGLITATIDERGGRTEYEYDALNRVAKVIEPDPDGNGPLASGVTTYQYDAAGNLESTTDARGNIARYQYDPLDRLIASIDALDQVSHYGYDQNGNLLTVIDQQGHSTRSEYDERDRLTRIIDAEGGITQFGYDIEDNLIRLVDPVGNVTSFRYDARSRQVEEIDPLGNRTRYVYDGADQKTIKTDRNERVTHFRYDDLGRLVREDWLNSDRTLANQVIYEYDRVGNLISAFDNFSSLAYTHDSRDRILTEDNLGTPDVPHAIIAYTYDNAGNVTSVTDIIDGQSGATTTYEYDALNRNTSITQTGAEVSDKRVDFAYNEVGRFDSIERYSDLDRSRMVVETVYQYDQLNRLSELRHKNGDNITVAAYEYLYDRAGRIAATNTVDGLTSYSYDQTGQVISVNHSDPIHVDESFSYDTNGNRETSHLHGSDYVTGVANRLVSDGTYEYGYDKEGNLISRLSLIDGTTRFFTWNHENQLLAVTDADSDGLEVQSVAFRYDRLNRRIVKEVEISVAEGNTTKLEFFSYENDDVVFTRRIIAVGSSETTSSTRTLHGPTVDQVLAEEHSNAAISWKLDNQVGTLLEAVDNEGNLESRPTVSLFGGQAESSTPETQRVFQGREFDSELQLSFHRNRYLDVSTGRFLSEDPLGTITAYAETVSANLYGFAANQPNLLTEPYGEAPVKTPSNVKCGSKSEVPVFSLEGTGAASISLNPGESVTLPNGVRCKCRKTKSGKTRSICFSTPPASSLGQLINESARKEREECKKSCTCPPPRLRTGRGGGGIRG